MTHLARFLLFVGMLLILVSTAYAEDENTLYVPFIVAAPTPSPTATPQPGVEVIDQVYGSSNGSPAIVGRVQNTTSQVVSGVKINVSFHDMEDRFLGSTSVLAPKSFLHPGESTCFLVDYSTSLAPADVSGTIDSVEYVSAASSKLPVLTLTHWRWLRSVYGENYLEAVVVNDGPDTVFLPKVILTVWADSPGSDVLIGCDSSYFDTSREALAPGRAARLYKFVPQGYVTGPLIGKERKLEVQVDGS